MENLEQAEINKMKKKFKVASQNISSITITNKNSVLFTPDDPIFSLQDHISREYLEISSFACSCCCNQDRKRGYCSFCGTSNCTACLFKSRPYPVNNP